MASTGQRCPLCGDSLLKFLYNPKGDYILNCSSRVCLYGALHAKVYHASEQEPAAATEVTASIIDGAQGTCAVAVPFTSSSGDSGGADGIFTTTNVDSNPRDVFNEASNQVDLFSTFEEMDCATRGDFHLIGTTGSTGPSLAFPESFDLCSEERDEDKDMINQWVRELSEQSSAAAVPIPVTQPVSPLLEFPTEVLMNPAVKATPAPVPTPSSPARTTARKVRSKSSLKDFGPGASARLSVPPGSIKIEARPVKMVAKSKKLLVPKLEKPTLKLPARLQRNQAIASILKSHLGASDDVRSETSSDSGVQSDASSDLSSSSSSLTPIQRLLHIEEAKKRSWGVTGMPGFKPSATASKGRSRKRPAVT
ncbi:uncharacterized protein LOC108864747 [Galendromus occidentalis]|uniref:Uncharacterized protein LOC108864747 n=1 Tax=Galendromus occidentalis TaxID=34638 RepID=A0AAJ7L5J8_9ACAR|nr:uncharacterized protein LOC108864747 [Galendromus occidentalis]